MHGETVKKSPIVVYAQNNLQRVSTYCGQSVVLRSIKAGGTNSDSCALMMQFWIR